MAETGVIKWFKSTYGFIKRDVGEDIFFHVSDVTGKGQGPLNKGDKVKFEVTDTEKGPRAVKISLTE